MQNYTNIESNVALVQPHQITILNILSLFFKIIFFKLKLKLFLNI